MPNELAIIPEGEEANPLTPIPLEALDMMERSRIDLQIEAARNHPRPAVEIIEAQILRRATRRRDIAQLCYYSLPRFDREEGKSKLIHGASIRLANIALGCWGNTLSGARTAANDGKVIKSWGICWDLEVNNQKLTEVHRRIVDKKGRPYTYDMQVQTAQAANSIAERNAILKVLGDDLYIPAFEACVKLIAGSVTDLIERRTSAMKWFAVRGVKYEQLLELLEKDAVDALNVDDVAYLSGLANAIREKVITLDEVFAPPAPDQTEETLRERLTQTLNERRKAREQAKP